MISGNYILQQLKKDLIGKDSHRGVTLTYAWLANQFGHFSLGFFPVIFFYCLHLFFLDEKVFLKNELPPYFFGLIVAIIWLVFEVFNFLMPILKDQKVKNFTPQWANLAFDTTTDILFFALGAFSASLTLELLIKGSSYSLVSKIGFFTVFAFLILPSSYWYKVRIFQQYAYLPFQFRLSQWSNNMSDDDKNVVNDFINKESSGAHLLVFGGFKCGKTSLGVGIANELAIRLRKASFMSATKLCASISNASFDTSLHYLWSWKDSDILIIDDVNPGNPIMEEFISADDFLNFIRKSYESSSIKEVFKTKNVVWILGSKTEALQCGWNTMLNNIGVDPSKINEINLC